MSLCCHHVITAAGTSMLLGFHCHLKIRSTTVDSECTLGGTWMYWVGRNVCEPWSKIGAASLQGPMPTSQSISGWIASDLGSPLVCLSCRGSSRWKPTVHSVGNFEVRLRFFWRSHWRGRTWFFQANSYLIGSKRRARLTVKMHMP